MSDQTIMNEQFPYNMPVPSEWDEATDVVIIGSGLAGIAAADAALDGGASVEILEKMSFLGGNTALSGTGFASSDSKLKMHERLGYEPDSWELHMQDTIKGGNNNSVPELAEVLAKNAPDALNWVIDCGVPFQPQLFHLGGHSRFRSHHAAVGGKQMIDILMNHIKEKGADVRIRSAVCGLCRDPKSGAVLGVCVKASPKEGAEYTYTLRAKKGVLIASGGFGSDVALRNAHNPMVTADYLCSNHPGATGEMIRMAQAIGADILHMAYIQLFPSGNPKSGAVDRYALLSYSVPGFGGVYVNREGKRFVNELLGRDAVSNAQVGVQERPTYCIINQQIFDQWGEAPANMDAAIRSGRLFKADTFDELQKMIEESTGHPMEPGILGRTIAAHDQYIADGKDPEFRKPMDSRMQNMKEGPYYAVCQWPTVHYTQGGLRIDTEARVIDVFGNPIPGLYAAGEVTGGTHGSNRLGGNALTECVVFGRIAGKNLAE